MRVREQLSDLTPPILKRAITGVFRKRGKASPTVVRNGVLTGRRMWLNSFSWWQRSLIDGSYDQEVLATIDTMDLCGTTVIDVGAYIGYYTLAFSVAVGEEGRVFALEPNPSSLIRLKKNISLNDRLSGRITVEPLCLADSVGQAYFSLSTGVDLGTASGSHIAGTITLDRPDVFSRFGFREVKVNVTTLDEFARERNLMPRLIKIDVEGAEAAVLRGASLTLRTYRPFILLEVHTAASMFDVGNLLEAYGYRTTMLKCESDGRAFLRAAPA